VLATTEAEKRDLVDGVKAPGRVQMSIASTVKHRAGFGVFVFVLAVALAGEGWADPYPFRCITNNDPASAAIGGSQLSVEITSPAADQALFTFLNVGDEGCAITDVYFDVPDFLGAVSILDRFDDSVLYAGVEFSSPARPLDFPEFDIAFSADAVNPQPYNGVNPGERLGVLYSINSGHNFVDVMNAFVLGDFDPSHPDSLRIGIKVQAFDIAGDPSERFVATPVPGAMFLGTLGLGVATHRLRRRKRA